MRREEKENFRLVRPMVTAVMCDGADNFQRITNLCAPNIIIEWPLCLQDEVKVQIMPSSWKRTRWAKLQACNE